MAAAVGAQDTRCACFLAGWHATAGGRGEGGARTALHSRAAQVEDVYERTEAAARGGSVWGGRAAHE